MAVPNVRNPIRPARGDLADLQANVANLYEGEIVFAKDVDAVYVVENGNLVKVGGGTQDGSPLNTAIYDAEAGETLTYDGALWRNGGIQDGGNF